MSGSAVAGLPVGASSPASYRPRRPDDTVLYRIVKDNLEAFLAHARETYARPLPRYVEHTLRNYLDCGILSRGFSRVRCPRCRHEFIVGFSCKGRSVCPSCGTRRMAAIAAHVTTKVLPDVPVRQWVLTAPWELRRLLAAKAVVLSTVARIFVRAVMEHYRRAARSEGVTMSSAGAVSFVQYFGGSLNAHPHVHVIFTDGSFAKTAGSTLSFFPAGAPSPFEIARVAGEVATKIEKWLRRRGLVRDDSEADEDDAPQTAADACMQAALHAGTFERLGAKDRAQAGGAQEDDGRFNHRKRSPWAAEINGFSVHAGVHIRASDAKGREILLRYCARPALSLERLSVQSDGRVAYRTKYPGRGGKTHRLMTPMEFMARISALIPPPRRPAFRYHGAFAPASRWRKLVVPATGAPPPKTELQNRCRGREGQRAPPGQRESNSAARSTPERASTPGALADSETPTASARTDQGARDAHIGRRSTSYIDWPSLMLRTYDIDVLQCPRCQGGMMVIVAITEHDVIEKILSDLRLPLEPEILSDGHTVAYDITDQSLIDSELGQDEQQRQRGPPED